MRRHSHTGCPFSLALMSLKASSAFVKKRKREKEERKKRDAEVRAKLKAEKERMQQQERAKAKPRVSGQDRQESQIIPLLHAAFEILLDSDTIIRNKEIPHSICRKKADYKALLHNCVKAIRDNDGEIKKFLKSFHVELDETWWTNHHEVTC